MPFCCCVVGYSKLLPDKVFMVGGAMLELPKVAYGFASAGGDQRGVGSVCGISGCPVSVPTVLALEMAITTRGLGKAMVILLLSVADAQSLPP